MALPKIILERREFSDEGTFGRLVLGSQSYFTGELPWRENRADISCIPLGIYEWIYTYSPRFRRNLYLATRVDGGRFGVRIHPANFMGDLSKGYKCQLNGCVALGERIGIISNQKGLLLSSPAVGSFERLMNYKPFVMEIINK